MRIAEGLNKEWFQRFDSTPVCKPINNFCLILYFTRISAANRAAAYSNGCSSIWLVFFFLSYIYIDRAHGWQRKQISWLNILHTHDACAHELWRRIDGKIHLRLEPGCSTSHRIEVYINICISCGTQTMRLNQLWWWHTTIESYACTPQFLSIDNTDIGFLSPKKILGSRMHAYTQSTRVFFCCVFILFALLNLAHLPCLSLNSLYVVAGAIIAELMSDRDLCARRVCIV